MSFSLDLSKFADDAIENSEEIIRGTAIKLFNAIIMDTPVDTGRARGNWFATGKKPSTQITEKQDKSGDQAASRMTVKIQSLSDVDIIQLTNNLPYIKALENGHSQQAPVGMAKVNITRFEKLLAEEARRRKL